LLLRALARRIQIFQTLAGEEQQLALLGRYFASQVAAQIQQTGLGLAVGRQCDVTIQWTIIALQSERERI
jgi:hypothetical protein